MLCAPEGTKTDAIAGGHEATAAIDEALCPELERILGAAGPAKRVASAPREEIRHLIEALQGSPPAVQNAIDIIDLVQMRQQLSVTLRSRGRPRDIVRAILVENVSFAFYAAGNALIRRYHRLKDER